MKSLLAIVRKDLTLTFSYRFAFLLRFVGILFTVTLWFFISRLVGAKQPNYFAFVILGMAAQTFLNGHLYGTASRLREEQLSGTLESVLATPTPPCYILIGGALADFLNALISFLFMLAAAWSIGPLHLTLNHPVTALLAILLSAGSFAALGSLSAYAVITFQKGNPFNFLLSSMQALLGTVFFPLSLLPAWLRGVGEWMPMTQSLAALRGTLLHGKGAGELVASLIYMLIFTILFMLLGTLLFRHALKHGRREGSLGRF